MAVAWPSLGRYQLGRFDPFGKRQRMIEVFNKGKESFTATAKVSAPWIILNHTSVQADGAAVFLVSIDWSNVPDAKDEVTGSVQITGTGWGGANIAVKAMNHKLEKRDPKGFVEADGYIAIEAKNLAHINCEFTALIRV